MPSPIKNNDYADAIFNHHNMIMEDHDQDQDQDEPSPPQPFCYQLPMNTQDLFYNLPENAKIRQQGEALIREQMQMLMQMRSDSKQISSSPTLPLNSITSSLSSLAQTSAPAPVSSINPATVELLAKLEERRRPLALTENAFDLDDTALLEQERNVLVRIEEEYGRAMNLKLMQKYSAQQWKQTNEQLSVYLKSLETKEQELRRKSDANELSIEKKRKSLRSLKDQADEWMHKHIKLDPPNQ